MKIARDISIIRVLYDIGHEPVKVINESQWYLSPLRKERKPSFKVNTMLNRWYDFGDQQGGNIIDLIIQIYGFTPGEALRYLSKYDVNTMLSSFGQREASSQIELLQVKPIQHKALKEYLQLRCIKENIYQKYCKEVHYQVRGKKYFAVGFENQIGGYELRSKFFKGCIGKKDISYIRNKSANVLIIFEGWFDYMSLLSLDDNYIDADAIILNSVANVKKIYSLLGDYHLVGLHLDNDPAGDKWTDDLMKHIHRGVCDSRGNYQGSKDLNEYLIHTSLNNNIKNNTL